MIDYALLTVKQSDYIRQRTDSWFNVAEGGKRAGKNIINLIAYAMCLEVHPDKLHLVAGVSLAQMYFMKIYRRSFSACSMIARCFLITFFL